MQPNVLIWKSKKRNIEWNGEANQPIIIKSRTLSVNLTHQPNYS